MFTNKSDDVASEDVDVQLPARMPAVRLAAFVQCAKRIVDVIRRNNDRRRSGVGVRSYRRPRHVSESCEAASYSVSFDMPELNPDYRPGPPDLNAEVLSFPARLLVYVRDKCNGIAPIAYKRAGVSRQIYSRIVSSDGSTVDKRTAMRFCVGLQLEMEEAELLMKAAGYAFSATLPEDEVFSYCIKHKIWNLEDINDIMVQSGLKPIL